jgi:hypothetical protein
MIAVPSEPQLPPLRAKRSIIIEKFIALKAVGVGFCAELEQTPADCADIGHTIFLFSLDACAANPLFKLTGQVFL